jgi:NAD(P)-dependent dehydrogenase (short-subunit alcohol dehydrogenase family)
MAGTDSRTFLVTGASTGIGRSSALRLDRRGHRVFAGVRKQSDADSLNKAASERLTTLFIDVTDEAGIAAAGATVHEAVGDSGLDGLVNNAGVVVPGPLEYVESADLRMQLEVNVVGQMSVTRQFIPLIRRAKGRIVFIGSISGRMATPFLGPYAASKHALEALTDSLRGELKPWGIQVAIIEPGSIATPIWEKGDATADDMIEHMDEEAHALYDDAIEAMRAAAKQFGDAGIPAAEVAKVVEHALTARRPKTRYIVGRDARLQSVMSSVLPDRMRDRVIAQMLKLPR